MISDDINISPRPLSLQRFCLKRRHHISTADQNDMIKQNRALSSGCHTMARRLPLTAVSAPSSFTKRRYPPPAVPSIPTQRKVSGIQNQLFTAVLRIFDHTVAVFVLDLSARSPTRPVELLLLIWTPASCAVK